MSSVIEVNNLTKIFKTQMAVDHINFKIEKGTVAGFLGPNGAGKSTTIKMLLGLLTPSLGTAALFGNSSEKLPADIWTKIGYVSEDKNMYDWMKVKEIISFGASFYQNWDKGYANELLKKLELPPHKKVKELSKGMKAKVTLLLALSFHPELLILDDPVSGLDPIVRHDFLEQIIELLQKEGRTVLFSSHILDEVERIADQILIINKGKMISDSSLANLKDSVKKVRVIFDGKMPEVNITGALKVKKNEHELTAVFKEFSKEKLAQFNSFSPKAIEVLDLNLQEIFIELVKED